MARYDRIATLSAPARERAFAAWPVLRDLEGSERDAELVRRARLRFLALRPVRRLLERGIEQVSAESLERQIEGVREELGLLPSRDPERARIAQFLHRIRQRTPLAVTAATLELGEVVEEAGQAHAAREFYRTALDLAAAYRLVPEELLALRLLGRLERQAGSWEEAAGCYTRAADLALSLDDRGQWARIMDGLGTVLRLKGEREEAARLYRELRTRGQEWGEDDVISTALGGLCLTDLDSGHLEPALEHGWAAFTLSADAEERYQLLATLGDIFTRLGLYRAAERCLTLAATRSRRVATRTRAELHLAESAAREGRLDSARDHLREAIGAAKAEGHEEILPRAEALLATLEHAAAGGGAIAEPHPEPGEAARRIAAEAESLGEPPVAATR
jgi:tetratricopeptide (TPR) repeat protein